MVARIGSQLPLLFQVERKSSVGADGMTPSIALAPGRSGKWAEDEDDKLKDAVQMHGGKNWKDIAALVPGRTITQCRQRWHDALNPSIALTAGRTGTWVEDEGTKLKDAVQIRGAKDWAVINAFVPGRTKKQCWRRWHDALNPSIDRTPSGRTGK
jgi:hypothetical protein